MRPLFNRGGLWAYPFYAGIGGSVGYWLIGVEERQDQFLNKKRDALLTKRRRMAERIRQSGEEGEPGMLAQGGAGVTGAALPIAGKLDGPGDDEGVTRVMTPSEVLAERKRVNAEEAARARGELDEK